MNNENRQSEEYDLTLSSNNPPLLDEVILGAIAKIQKCLSSGAQKDKLIAVEEAAVQKKETLTNNPPR